VIYDFWKNYENILFFEQANILDCRLDNIIIKLSTFFQRVIIKPIEKENISFFIAGSCLKSDTFNDLDIFFNNKEDLNLIDNSLNKDFFEYSNNSKTYKYKNELYQLVFREKYNNCTLKELINGFDFASTKLGFKCNYNTKLRTLQVEELDLREEFIMYINTKYNPLLQMSINPMVSLQRALLFTKRGDDVPFETFLNIIDKVTDMKLNGDFTEENFLKNLKGNPNKLQNIKEAIQDFVNEENNK